MPLKDKEKQKEYSKQYYLKSKEKQKEYSKQYRLKNKEYQKEYYLKNKKDILKKQREYKEEYNKTPQRKKTIRISNWKHHGILCFDYNLLYDIFLSTNRCEYCDCELNKCNKSRKCLDHDHSITDKFNIRAVLCMQCNLKDVLREKPAT
tara:strand:+ start:485 stop:931 length:447 start_codon:yes stop_codon:yes gene_type:complete